MNHLSFCGVIVMKVMSKLNDPYDFLLPPPPIMVRVFTMKVCLVLSNNGLYSRP